MDHCIQKTQNAPSLGPPEKSRASSTLPRHSSGSVMPRVHHSRVASPLQQSFHLTDSTLGSESADQAVNTHPLSGATSELVGPSQSMSAASMRIDRQGGVGTISSSTTIAALPSRSSRHGRSSVKHLTCFWWKEKGYCKYSNEECLYAHFDTGRYTDPPRQVVPGEPAMAGRKLERTVHALQMKQNISRSVSSAAGSHQSSRSSTPAFEVHSPDTAHLMVHPSHYDLLHSVANTQHLSDDNKLFKDLLAQSSKEKAILCDQIENLKGENTALKDEVQSLHLMQKQLMDDCEKFQRHIQHIEAQHQQFRDDAHRIDAVRRSRRPTETQLIGGLLDD